MRESWEMKILHPWQDTHNVFSLGNSPAGLDGMSLTVLPGCLPAPLLVGVATLGLPDSVALLLLLGLGPTNTTTTVSHVAALLLQATTSSTDSGVVATSSTYSRVIAASSSSIWVYNLPYTRRAVF